MRFVAGRACRAIDGAELALIIEEKADSRQLLGNTTGALVLRISGDAEKAGLLVVEQLTMLADETQ